MTAGRGLLLLLAWTAALPSALAATTAAATADPRRSELETLEGTVVALEEVAGESDLPVLVADLDRGDGREPARVLLAPRTVLEEIELEVEVGDRIKVRIFADEGTPLRVHRLRNETRGTMARLRTLSRVPLWSSTGAWQGGEPHGPRGPGPHGPAPVERAGPPGGGARAGGPPGR